MTAMLRGSRDLRFAVVREPLAPESAAIVNTASVEFERELVLVRCLPFVADSIALFSIYG